MTCSTSCRLPPAALAAIRRVAGELTVRESMIFLNGRDFTGEPPGPSPGAPTATAPCAAPSCAGVQERTATVVTDRLTRTRDRIAGLQLLAD